MTAVVEGRVQETAARPGGPERVRRTGAAVSLVLAPWGFVITNALYWWSTRNGGSDSTGVAALALVQPQAGLFRVLLLAGLLGCLLVVPATVAAMGLAPRSWLAFVGATLMIGGYIAYFGVLLTRFSIIAMAEHGGPLADFAAVIDATDQDASTTWVFLLFVVGNLVGTLLLAIGLLRSRAIPRWATILIMLWAPLHVVGLVVGNELFEVTGAVLQAVGFAAAARVVMRRRGT